MQPRTVVPYAAILATVLACGGSGYGSPTQPAVPPAGPPTASATVQATPSIAFTPSTVNVVAGGTVTFAFGTVGHNVYFSNATGAPANITGVNANTSVARTFVTAGTFAYTCHIHPEMTGTIVVAAADTAAANARAHGSGIGPE